MAPRLVAQLDGVTAAARLGLEQHDRWALARTLLLRKLDGRRSTSRLQALVEYVAARPIVSAGMIADELGVTPRAAQDLVAELGLREATGRRRYRAWGIL
jgi:HTH DNA binding domain